MTRQTQLVLIVGLVLGVCASLLLKNRVDREVTEESLSSAVTGLRPEVEPPHSQRESPAILGDVREASNELNAEQRSSITHDVNETLEVVDPLDLTRLRNVDLQNVPIEALVRWRAAIRAEQQAEKEAFMGDLTSDCAGLSHDEYHRGHMLGSNVIYFETRRDGELVYLQVSPATHQRVYELRDLASKVFRAPAYQKRVQAEREDLIDRMKLKFGDRIDVVESEDGGHVNIWATLNGERRNVAYTGESLID